MDEAGSKNGREDSTVKAEWLEALVNDVEIETSSSQEELELGSWLCHGLELFHEDRSHQLGAGVEEEVATELSSVHSSPMSISTLL